jgi:hypothetical protein
MKKRLMKLTGLLGLFYLGLFAMELSSKSSEKEFFFSNAFTRGFSQQSLPDVCGPLMGNSSGTRYCCANQNATACFAATCGGGPQT